MVSIEKYPDNFWAAVCLMPLSALALVIVGLCFDSFAGIIEAIILCEIICGILLVRSWYQLYFDQTGITVVRMKLFKKKHPWRSSPTVCVASLWERMSEHGRYILIFLGETPASLEKRQKRLFWYESHRRAAIHIPYSEELLTQLKEAIPDLKIVYY